MDEEMHKLSKLLMADWVSMHAQEPCLHPQLPKFARQVSARNYYFVNKMVFVLVALCVVTLCVKACLLLSAWSVYSGGTVQTQGRLSVIINTYYGMHQ